MSTVRHARVIILGSGPAGYSAAVYAARGLFVGPAFPPTAYGGEVLEFRLRQLHREAQAPAVAREGLRRGGLDEALALRKEEHLAQAIGLGRLIDAEIGEFITPVVKGQMRQLHANLEALQTVLWDAQEQGCSNFVCLGEQIWERYNHKS